MINRKYGKENVKYIKQFSLVNGNESQDKNMYDNLLSERKTAYSRIILICSEVLWMMQ